MTIYELTDEALIPLERTTFVRSGHRERDHIQQILKRSINVVSPDTLVIAEEFSEWEESKRRIDLLGVDKTGALVVIELKRTEDGGHMELQSIRYAAMVSTLTFARAVEIYQKHLEDIGKDGSARELLLAFLELDEPDEDSFGQDVRIVLVSGDFSKELTTSVIWLNDHDLDIRCIRMRPYQDGSRTLLDVQQVIPLPESQEYQIRIREKVREERVARTDRDLTRFDVKVDGTTFRNLPKRRAIFQIIFHLWRHGVSPQEIAELISWRTNSVRCVDGHLSSIDFALQLSDQLIAEGSKPEIERFYIGDDELMKFNGKTYAITKMWGPRTKEAIELLAKQYPQFPFECAVHKPERQ